jgi:hypothetical protein
MRLPRIPEKRFPNTSYAGDGKEETDRPAALVLSLQSTLVGCEWMLGQRAAPKAILDAGQVWLPCDKLKAVRLLGKQPIDAIDDRDVAMVFIATSVITGGPHWFWEISTELSEVDLGQFRNDAAARKFKSFKPKDVASAREALFSIIERATERLTLKAEVHRERARVIAALAPDLMAFEDGPEGERLRRFDLARSRGLSRSLEDLRKHRRVSLSVVSGPLSVVSGPLSVVDGTLEASDTAGRLEETHSPSIVASPYQPDAQARVSSDQMTRDAHYQPDAQARETEVHRIIEVPGLDPSLARRVGASPEVPDVTFPGEFSNGGSPNATNEAIDANEDMTNEANIGPLSVVGGPLPMVGCAFEEIDEQNETNEANIGLLSVVGGPLPMVGCAFEEIDEQNETNEPNVGPLPVVRGPLPMVGCAFEEIGEQNETNEPDVGPLSVVRGPLPTVGCAFRRDRRAKRNERTHRGSRPLDERTQVCRRKRGWSERGIEHRCG